LNFDDLFPCGVILSVAVLQAEGGISRATEPVLARSLARLKNAGLRDDASEKNKILGDAPTA